MFSRPILAVPLLLVLASDTASAQRIPAAPGDRVEPELWIELSESADGRAYVIVLLEDLAPASLEDDELRRAQVDLRQDQVLASLAPEEFELAYRYENIAALTGRATVQAVDLLNVHPLVESIGIDRPGSGATSTSVPFIRADVVHTQLNITGEGVTVAVLDSGIDTDHLDLQDSIAPGGMHFLNQGASVGTNIEDGHGHGTNVSGIITSNGTIAPTGVAPDADVLVVRVLDNNNSGWLSDWTAGVDYVVSVKDDYALLPALNMSLVSSTLYTQCHCNQADASNRALSRACVTARNIGIEIFASQGNTGHCARMTSPACLGAVHAVAAVFDLGLPDHVTTFTSQSDCNDLAAPGVSITSTGRSGGLSTFTGTSQASPHVTGVAALLAEARPTGHRRQTVLPAILRATAVPTIQDTCPLRPTPLRVDAFEAVRLARGPRAWPASGIPGTPVTYEPPSLLLVGPRTDDGPTTLRVAGTAGAAYVLFARTVAGAELGAVASGRLSALGSALVDLPLGRLHTSLVFSGIVGSEPIDLPLFIRSRTPL